MHRHIVSLVAAASLVAAGCTSNAAVPTTSTQAPEPTTSTAPPTPIDATEFGRFIGQVAADLLLLEPQTITDLGADSLLGRADARLDDLSPATQRRRVDIATSALAALGTVDRSDLSPDEQVTAAILEWHLTDILTLDDFRNHQYPVNYITGYQAWLPEFMSDIHPLDNEADASAYISRLDAAGTQMQQLADNVRRSATAGILPTQIGVDIALWQIGNMTGSASSHPLVSDFIDRLLALDITDAVADDLTRRATAAVRESVVPGYEALRAAVSELTPRSDRSPGVLELPEGDAYYAAALRHFVSADVTPADAHALGLEHVRRLKGELIDTLVALGYDVESGLGAAITQAQQDAGATPLGDTDDRTAFLDATTSLIERTPGAFAGWFESFPDTPIQVVRPRPGREGGSGAYYSPPPIDGSRPGLYYLSLGGSEFPMLTYATTNFHEAIPGHHFQLASQRESRDLPLLQRATTFAGFAEGWGLYAERLAFEAGLYDDDPLGNVGRLRMELLRAARVVADTGIHALGWSRDEAVEYLTELGFPQGNAEGEVDRYIVWPGQAPSYMIGMLEILRLRDVATGALGEAFDIAEFHTEILRHGSVPLAVLDDVIANWIASNA